MAAHLPSPVQAYFDAVHASDAGMLANCFTENASLHFPMQDPIIGLANIREFYKNVFVFYKKRHDEITGVMVSGDGNLVGTLIHFDGTTGDGKDVTFDAVDVFDLSDNKISKLRIYYDSARVLQMLGGLPSAK